MNFNQGNVFYIADFDDTLEATVTLPLITQIQKQNTLRNGRIDLYINSFGGYTHLVEHMIEVVEIAKRAGTVVRTIVPSAAFSSGSMLAIAGTPGERYIARDAEHLIHYGSVGSVEETPMQIDRWSAFKKRGFAKNIKHYKKYADVPGLDSEMLDDGFFVPAPKCLKYKLADKYIEKFDIGENSGGMDMLSPLM